jgi:arylsulfatase A-like enzyme
MNIFIITLDDVNFYNLGFTNYFKHYSSPTPNIDRFAEESYTFWNAHCNIPFCQQSRMVLFTGLYPQNNGAVNFNPINEDVVTLSSLLKENNFKTHIVGKLCHHKPDSCFQWDTQRHYWDADIYNFLSYEIKTNKNNLFVLNTENTHRPFYYDFTNGIPFEFAHEKFINNILKIKSKEDKPLYKGNLPSNLLDSDTIRKDIYSFFKSLKKADDVIGDILSFAKDEDIVVLTSDHGFSFPYFKGNCYGSSTNVPLIIRNKNIIHKHDKDNVVSHVDFVPTILDLLNIKSNTMFDGKSYLKILQGEKIEGFDFVYSQLNKMATGGDTRVRAISDKEFTYCINLDDHNAQCVDGWGWHRIIDDMKQNKKCLSWTKRKKQELIKYNKMDIFKINNYNKKELLKKKLFEYMKNFKDIEYNNLNKYNPEILYKIY